MIGELAFPRHLQRVLGDKGVYREYAKAYLNEAQIDAVDPSQLPGLTAGVAP